MRSSSGDADLFDCRATAGTGFAFAAENLRKTDVAAFFTLGIDVVSVAATAFVDG